ncbi:MAG: hypothetical protein LBE09_00545 [Christensenellaceae bacterium]|jgi:signal peptidase I|nr:hypothetical protein [Christensenellaceae bacterium]
MDQKNEKNPLGILVGKFKKKSDTGSNSSTASNEKSDVIKSDVDLDDASNVAQLQTTEEKTLKERLKNLLLKIKDSRKQAKEKEKREYEKLDEKTKRKRRILKIINVVANVFLCFVLVVVLFLGVMAISKKNNDNDYNNLFGYTYLSVISDSMVGDNKDSFNVGDLVIAKIIKGDYEAINDLEVGDVISFFMLMDTTTGSKERALNTHRIIEVHRDNDNPAFTYFITKGDNVLGVDSSQVVAKDVIAVYSGKIAKLGTPIAMLQQKEGFLYFVLIPTSIAVLYCLYLFIFNLMGFIKVKAEEKYAGDKTSATLALDVEEKERIKLELLREMGMDPEMLRKITANADPDTTIDTNSESKANPQTLQGDTQNQEVLPGEVDEPKNDDDSLA